MLIGRGLARGRKWLRAGSSWSNNGWVWTCSRGNGLVGGSWRLGTAARAAAAAVAGTAALGLTARTAQVGAVPRIGLSWELLYITQARPVLSHVLNEWCLKFLMPHVPGMRPWLLPPWAFVAPFALAS